MEYQTTVSLYTVNGMQSPGGGVGTVKKRTRIGFDPPFFFFPLWQLSCEQSWKRFVFVGEVQTSSYHTLVSPPSRILTSRCSGGSYTK